jgi:NitT/TauT family transport system permease protein
MTTSGASWRSRFVADASTSRRMLPSARAAKRALSDDTRVLVGRTLVILGILVAWEIAARRGLVDPFFFSMPSAIVVKLGAELVDRGFYADFWVTAKELVVGYAIGAAGGIALAVVLARWSTAGRILDPILIALNSIPRIALAPLLIVWCGIDLASKIVLAATLVFFITFFNTLAGFRTVEHGHLNVARVQGASEWQLFTKVMLPSASSWIITGLKTSLPFGLTGVIVGEFLVSSSGLGYRLNAYSTGYNTTGSMAMLFVMMALMMALNAGMERIERRLLRWRPRQALVSKAQL